MSVRISGKVWELNLRPNQKLVLLALADHADHFGENAHPGDELLSLKTGFSERQVQRILNELESAGILEKTAGGQGRGRKRTYSIRCEKGDILTGFADRKRRQVDALLDEEKATSATEKGDIRDIGHDKERARVLTVNNRPPSAQSRAGTICPVCSEPCGIGASDVGAIAICGTCGNHRIDARMPPQARKRKRAALKSYELPNEGCVMIFREAYAKEYELPYIPDAGDVAQYNKMRASYNGELTPESWGRAVGNFFLTPRDNHRLKELCSRFAEFQKSAFDRFKKPVIVQPARRPEIVT